MALSSQAFDAIALIAHFLRSGYPTDIPDLDQSAWVLLIYPLNNETENRTIQHDLCLFLTIKYYYTFSYYKIRYLQNNFFLNFSSDYFGQFIEKFNDIFYESTS